MKVMFLDESGDHRLKKINATYPIFVLGGVIVDRSYVRTTIEPGMRRFKRRVFGREDVILHTVDMRNNAGDFAFLTDPARRSAFYTDLNAMLDALDYQVIAVVIEKQKYLSKHGSSAEDLYIYALKLLIERFCLELGNTRDAGFICAEKRDPTLDRELMAAWEALRSPGGGTHFASSRRIEERIVGLDLRDKKPNLAAMQIADLVLTPVGRHVLNSPPKADQVQWSVVEKKLRRVGGTYWGRGLVVRP